MRPSESGPIGRLTLALIIVAAIASGAQALKKKLTDFERKSIVFDLKTPKVFYCPQDKPSDPERLIVMAQPLDRLCQFGGKSKPRAEPSDCYNDIDETQFACDEKRRFMVKLDLLDELESDSGDQIDKFDLILAQNSGNNNKKRLGRSSRSTSR